MICGSMRAESASMLQAQARLMYLNNMIPTTIPCSQASRSEPGRGVPAFTSKPALRTACSCLGPTCFAKADQKCCFFTSMIDALAQHKPHVLQDSPGRFAPCQMIASLGFWNGRSIEMVEAVAMSAASPTRFKRRHQRSSAAQLTGHFQWRVTCTTASQLRHLPARAHFTKKYLQEISKEQLGF